jgi:circadian clock protein KaiB
MRGQRDEQLRHLGERSADVAPAVARKRKFSMPEGPPGRETGMKKYQLKLFITGQTQRSERAISNLRRICEEELETGYKLVIIDVLEQPQAAEKQKILATPTLIKENPPPVRRIIGDLSDTKQVLLGLELVHQESRSREE